RAHAWLEDDALVLLLDGLDEVVAHRRRAVVEMINAYRAQHPTGMVIACRDATYAGLGVRLNVGAALRVAPPSDGALDRMCADHGAARDALWRALAADPRAPRPSPLVVSLWLRAAASGAAPSGAPPAPGDDALSAT